MPKIENFFQEKVKQVLYFHFLEHWKKNRNELFPPGMRKHNFLLNVYRLSKFFLL